MRSTPTSVAMTGSMARDLEAHLLRSDGQEDLCLATYRPSAGTRRTSALLREFLPPEKGEREVHGNASFKGQYVVRASQIAAPSREGVVLLHSHPGGHGWQGMSSCDEDAERSYAYLAHEMTGLPLVGMTLAGGDKTWSARVWEPYGTPRSCESVRVVGDQLRISWNGDLRPRPLLGRHQLRTRSAWGEVIQADIARVRALVVGLGSVGLEVALRLAATGIVNIGIMDFDTIEEVNLDRLVGATSLDACLHRAKTDVAHRLLLEAATARDPRIDVFETSICEPQGLARALNYDVVFSCVDRPWPRAVLNMLAYSDLIPVIDGGIHIDPFVDGGIRNATWRSHVVRPGRPCLACNKQLDLGAVSADREGLWDDPSYIAGFPSSDLPARENVAALSVGVVSSLLTQFVSFVVAPGGRGDPGPLQYVLSTHTLGHRPDRTMENCYFEKSVADGDLRLDLTDQHAAAEEQRALRRSASSRFPVRLGRMADKGLGALRNALLSHLHRRSSTA